MKYFNKENHKQIEGWQLISVLLILGSATALLGQPTKHSETSEMKLKQIEEKEAPGRSADQKDNSKSSQDNGEEGYVSPLKENGLTADYNRTMFIDPELAKKFNQRKKAWVGDWLRVGAYIRPRWEDRYNLNFDKSNKADTSRILQTSQLFLLLDPSPYFSMKINIQDARVWGGGSTPASVGDVRANAFANTGTTITPGEATNIPSQTTIREAWFMMKKLPLDAKVQVGRMAMAYGDQRMIGSANWTINGLSYDGARVMFDQDHFNIHLLGTKIVGNQSGPNGVLSANAPVTVTDPVTGKTTTVNPGQPDKYLVGSYNTIKPNEWFLVDLYALGMLTHKAPTFAGTSSTFPATPATPDSDLTQNQWSKQQDNLITTGFRITNRTAKNYLPTNGPWGSWDWSIESAWQSGSTGSRVNRQVLGQDITQPVSIDGVSYNVSVAGTQNQKYSGRFMSLQTGYTFFEKLRLGTQYILSSGDANRKDGSNSTFQTLTMPRFGIFPYWNNVAGLSENTGSKNLRSLTFNIEYKSEKFGTFYVSYFINNKDKVQDAWYAINGTANTGFSTELNAVGQKTAVIGTPGRNIYNEFDIAWSYLINDYVSLWIGAGFLSAGSAVKNQRNALYSYDLQTGVISQVNANVINGTQGAASQARMFYMQFNAAF
ncbi:alginate export [Leptospira fainei serovar Hurstbridge str. BUT 6]|uniref:Alginate export n=1 Tax=Leptospira fainei serovar Hurstbridge str. BUT 6 TaxID=1193011 RepID=S3UWH6_9LEPT|nr:alginate export family protein [Leptospira fainei]EPG72709.1 alginate export [Leptospira fainei serovar Hurstbridge str. BUT 6]